MDTAETIPPVLARRIGLILGPLLAAALWWGPWLGLAVDSERPELNRMAAVAALMALWWLTDAIPMAVTGLLPLVLLPAARIMPVDAVAANYGSSVLYLFLGGFLVALAVEGSGLHERVALAIVSRIGHSPRRLLLGFMLATAVLSMWLSNTATTMMMLPIALSVVGGVSRGATTAPRSPLAVALMLAIAYSASIGGFATLIGTPTNVQFRQLYQLQFGPAAPPISFGGWMVLAVPLSLTFLIGAWLLLGWFIFPLGTQRLVGDPHTLDRARAALGPLREAERRAAAVFLVTALLWIFREPVTGWGWAAWLGLGRQADGTTLIDDATVAVAMAVVCFLIPASGRRGPALLSWRDTERVPWGVLLLFGGGLALADGLQQTGLDAELGARFGHLLTGWPILAMIGATSTGMTFFTELTGNVPCVNMSMPVLASLAQNLGCDPRLLMVPAALSASCAFMLPVSTPPNAIVFGSGHVRLAEMVRAGIWLNLLGIALVVLFTVLVGPWALGIQTEGLPAWAAPAALELP